MSVDGWKRRGIVAKNKRTHEVPFSFIYLSVSRLNILPLGGVEERTLEALGAVDEGHHEDVGQRGFDGHEDLFARGEREVRGWGLRRCGRHLASNLELLRASVRAGCSGGVRFALLWYGVGCGLCALRSAPVRSVPSYHEHDREPSDRISSSLLYSALFCVATRRPLFFFLSLYRSSSLPSLLLAPS